MHIDTSFSPDLSSLEIAIMFPKMKILAVGQGGTFCGNNYCPAQIQVLSSKSKVSNPKSKVQRKGTRTGADGKRPSMTFLDLPWPSMTLHDLPWPFRTFYHLLRALWLSMIKCLLSRPGLISGPLKPKPKLILTQFQGLTLSTPSLVWIIIGQNKTILNYVSYL